MKIALVQQQATENMKTNVAKGIEALEFAASQGARLIAYSELSFTRFLPQHHASIKALELSEEIPGSTSRLFSDKAKESEVVVVINLLEKDQGRMYNCSPMIDMNGEIAGKTRMIHIEDSPLFHEKEYYSPGNLGAGVFNTSIGCIGVAICYDRHFPEYMRALALKGAELVIVPQAGVYREWPPGMFEAELRVAAFQNGYFVALVNRVGREDSLFFSGGSFVATPSGQIIARAPSNRSCILFADIDFTQVKQCIARKQFLLDRRPEVYANL